MDSINIMGMPSDVILFEVKVVRVTETISDIHMLCIRRRMLHRTGSVDMKFTGKVRSFERNECVFCGRTYTVLYIWTGSGMTIPKRMDRRKCSHGSKQGREVFDGRKMDIETLEGRKVLHMMHQIGGKLSNGTSKIHFGLS